MRRIQTWGLTAVSAALLVACGGTDNSEDLSIPPTTRGNFSAVVSFGDSLSDLGAYAPATSLTGNGAAPYFGGKFTNNSATSTVWVENVAATLKLSISPAEVGFNGVSSKCPAATTTCTGYGQGGSRVTDPAGIGRTATGGGALTVPMKTQISNHLARFGSFKSSDLIFVYGGNNDAFVQFGVFSAKVTDILTRQAAGTLTAAQAGAAQNEAVAAAQAEMRKAAVELASYVRTEIVAKGGRYVAVMNLPDSTLTPFGSTLPATAKPVLSGLVDTFNVALKDALAGAAIRFVEQNTTSKDVYQNPSKYGFTNNTLPTCDAAKIQGITGGAITDGSSLFCSSAAGVPYNGLRTGADVSTWQFADGVHPTTGGHKAISDEVLKQVRSFGWIS
jgi:outer membrane lipase/esterase